MKNTKSLSKREYDAIEMIFEGKTKIEIAEAMGVSRQAVHKWFNKQEFQDELRKMSLDAFKYAVPVLVNHMVDLATKAKSESVQFQATQDILDRIGLNSENAGEEEIVDVQSVLINALKEDDEDEED